MAKQEPLDIIKKGVNVWNRWREKHPGIQPDLRAIDLSGADLRGVNFARAYLAEADLSKTILIEANFRGAILTSVDLTEATLIGADLRFTDLTNADLIQADLRAVDLRGADMRQANLDKVTFGRATTSFASWPDDLRSAELEGTDLGEADFNGEIIRHTVIGSTIFGDIDLSTARGLDIINHNMPSTIGIDTIIRSKGKISTSFLKRVGIPDSIIEALPSLIGALKPIDYYTCFISHSSRDDVFVKRLYADLQSNNVRCWFASEDLKIGDHYHQRIDESIRLYDKLILILSEHAIQSAWVEREVVAAREKEDHEQRLVLFPIRLDDAVMNTTKAWAADVRRRWHIGDFTQWKQHDAYQKAFERLLNDLKAENEQDGKNRR